jgi:hypothetical protein
VYGWKGNLSKFWYRWSEASHLWGCGWCYLWHAATSVGNAGISIWHLPRHTWGSHRVLVRCENNFENSPLSQNIARRHMFNSTCEINFWKCILLFLITLYNSSSWFTIVQHWTNKPLFSCRQRNSRRFKVLLHGDHHWHGILHPTAFYESLLIMRGDAHA